MATPDGSPQPVAGMLISPVKLRLTMILLMVTRHTVSPSQVLQDLNATKTNSAGSHLVRALHSSHTNYYCSSVTGLAFSA